MTAVIAAETIITVIGKAFGVADKLLAKTPNYEQRKKEDYLDLKKNFEVYGSLPIEKRVNSYLHNLHIEVINHVEGMVDSL